MRGRTAETTTTTRFDTLTVTVGGSTVDSASNLNAASGYVKHTVNLASFIGSTVTVTFTADDAAVNVS